MLTDTINLDRTYNIIKMFDVIRVELVSALPSTELAPYFRELSAIQASLWNRIRLENPDYGPQEAGQRGTEHLDSTGTAPTGDGAVDPQVQQQAPIRSDEPLDDNAAPKVD